MKVENKEFIFPHKLGINTKNKATFIFEGKSEEIDYLSSSCGCTTPELVGNDTIIVYYNAPNRPTMVLQKVFIWLNDGQDRYKLDKVSGQSVINTDKKHIELIIKGEVI